jgi:hypothetical protein
LVHVRNPASLTRWGLQAQAAYAAHQHVYYVRAAPPVDLEAGAAATDDLTCLICMSAIEPGTVHMRTPCDHHFHAPCLETVRPCWGG